MKQGVACAPPAPSARCLGQHTLGVVSFLYGTLAREGRMTVTIGRRELLVALGGAVVLWAIAATGPGAAQQPSKIPRVGILTSRGRVLEKISKEIK